MFALRNKEFRMVLILTVISIFIFFLIGLWTDKRVAFLLLTQGVLLCVYFISLTLYRYNQIKKLTVYLKRIQQGEYSLDIRDNKEGELSILKSEIYKVTNMLSEYNEKLKNDKKLLSEHMADISHQLKTPLTSMMVMVDLLKDENLPADKRKQFTSQIYTQLERIEWLVTSLLTISKLDAGVIEMKQVRIKAGDLIQAAIEPVLIPMELKEIDLIVSGDDTIITCDPHWMREALMNILKNCIEHTMPGGKLKISVNDNPLYSEIEIEDTGVGIAKEDLPYIFTRFYRGKNSSSDSVGIGLAMSRSIILRQGGDISVKSKEGQGSTFTVKLYKSVI